MSSGYCYGEKEPREQCPYCGTECRAEFVDVGVGMVQVTPFVCENCYALQIGPHDKDRHPTMEERGKGWYRGEI